MDARAMIAKRGGTLIQQVAGHRLQPVGRKGNTWVGYDGGGNVYLILHYTRIVTIDPEGYVRLNSGGHQTATTKRRMNQALEALIVGGHVYQEEFIWYYSGVPFVEGEIIGRVKC